MIKLLVVDDSALMRRLLGEVFKSQGDFEVEFARDGLEALEKLHTFNADVVTLDINMPNLDGLACLDRIMVEHPTRVIMVSSLTAAGASVTLDAMKRGGRLHSQAVRRRFSRNRRAWSRTCRQSPGRCHRETETSTATGRAHSP